MKAKGHKKTEGQNVRISDKAYAKIRKFIDVRGWKVGWFFETAALEKMENELAKEKHN